MEPLDVSRDRITAYTDLTILVQKSSVEKDGQCIHRKLGECIALATVEKRLNDTTIAGLSYGMKVWNRRQG